MKKASLIITSVFLILAFAKGQTNVYQPFPNDSALWDYQDQGPMNTTYRFIKWLGDTVINLKTYKKEYTSTSLSPLLDNSTWWYSCGIRQDIPNEKIYKIVGGVETDVSVSQHLHVGDSMPINPVCKWAYRIVSIDSIQIGDKFHKRYNCKEDSSSTATESYIVGVGEVYYSSCFEGVSSLSCYSVDNNLLYGDPKNPYCPQLVTSINNEQFENYLTISPNPFSSSTTLKTDNPFKNATLTLYNLHGQKVKQIKNISEQTVTLYRDNLPSGLYFILLTQDNKIFSADKLVITDE